MLQKLKWNVATDGCWLRRDQHIILYQFFFWPKKENIKNGKRKRWLNTNKIVYNKTLKINYVFDRYHISLVSESYYSHICVMLYWNKKYFWIQIKIWSKYQCFYLNILFIKHPFQVSNDELIVINRKEYDSYCFYLMFVSVFTPSECC